MNKEFYHQIEAAKDSLPPVENWDPPLSGDMDCCIRRDGSWWIDGERLENTRLQRLFSTVLKREGDEYFLLTPVEKWRISVEDLPFLIVALDIENQGSDEQSIQVRTNVGDNVYIDETHTIASSIVAGVDDKPVIPYVLIRGHLQARFSRNTFLELAEILIETQNKDEYLLHSKQQQFILHLP